MPRIENLLQRFPWFLPAVSFASGWLSFVLVKRGDALARLVALLSLLGWLWLLVEPLVRHYLERRRAGVGKFVANFLSQSLQQEMLFFALPLLFGATQLHPGQLVFTAIAVAAAVLTTLDPIYERYIAAHAAARLAFHAYCSLIAAVVVLPMVVRLPLEQVLPLSLLGVGIWLLLTAPMSLRSLHTKRRKVLWLVGSCVAPLTFWLLRSQVPAAGLVVTTAVVTHSIAELEPGPAISRLSQAELQRGMVAFAAIRAPSGMSQTVVFEWHHGAESERITSQIFGGRAAGWRTYSRKQAFPQDARGRWTVDILTPQRQLLKRLSFVVI
jgi:Family of unknown function (DUF5924)/Protein of unknown function (DUF2914)